MDVFELFARINLDTSAYESGLNDASNKFKSFGDNLMSGMGTLAKWGGAALAGTTTAVIAFGAESVKAGMSFDTSMSQVAATMGKTVDELKNEVGSVSTSFGEFNGNLRDFALFMGQNTAFSATQAADALNYMALAGYTTQESMTMLPNVLSLAAAGAMDLATASDMVTDTQSAFGIEAERTTQMVDEMAKAASTGNTSVQQLGNAFLVVGGLAKDLNGGMVTLDDGTTQAVDGIQELEIALTAMANSGIKGSEAGTHMRNMLLKLSSPTDEGAKAFERLGVSVFDSEGKMRSLKDIFSDLDKGLSTLTQEEKLNAISNIFNTRDVAAAQALLAAVGEDWDDIGASILDAEGAASEMAATQLDNLAGDITLFKSALEGAEIAISDNLKEPLRDFVQFGTAGLSELTTAFQEGGLEGAMSAFGNILSNAVTMIIDMLPEAVNAGMQLLGAIVQGIIDNQGVILEAVGDIISVLLDGISAGLEETGDGGGVVAFIDGLIGIIEKNLDKLLTVGVKLITSLLDGMTNSLPKILPKIAEVIVKIAKALTDPKGISAIVKSAVDIITALVKGLFEAIPILINAVPEIINNVIAAIMDAVPLLLQGITDIVSMIVEFLPELITSIIDALPGIIEGLVNAITDLLPMLIDGLVNLVLMIANALPDIIQSIVSALPKIIELVINAVISLLPVLINGLVQLIQGIVKALPVIIQGIVDSLPVIIQAIIDGLLFAIPQLIDGLIMLVQLVVDNLPTIIFAIVNALPDIIESIINGLLDCLPQLIGGLVQLVIALVEHLPEIYMALIEAIPEIIAAIIVALGGLVGEAGALALEVVQKIAEVFGQLVEDAVQWGVDMMKALAEGIKNGAQWVWDQVTSVAEGISDLIHFSAPEKGPLADYESWMPDFMKGLAEGVENNAKDLQDTVSKAFDFRDVMEAPTMTVDAAGSINAGDYRTDDLYMPQMISLLKQIAEKDTSVTIEGDAKEIFNVVESENRKQMKATGYNQLAMMEV